MLISANAHRIPRMFAALLGVTLCIAVLSACGGGGGSILGGGPAPVTPTTPIAITTTSLPSGTEGSPYSATVQASGGTGTGYAWGLDGSGTLPTGVQLVQGQNATLSGTPTFPSAYNFSLRVTDSGGNTTVQPFSVQILPQGTTGISIDNQSVAEGNSGTTTMTFNVTLTQAAAQVITVDWATTDGTATTANSDYTTANGTLTFNITDSAKTIVVDVIGDTVDEGPETFTVSLTNASSNAVIAAGTGTGTITNDDAAAGLPTVSIGNASVDEGNSGTVTLSFPVTLSAPSAQTVTVLYSTGNGTATTADNDYLAVTNTLITFAPSETAKTADVTINGDTTSEADESLTVTLGSATNASMGTSVGTGTIKNDDVAPPALSFKDIGIIEGNPPPGGLSSSTTVMNFFVNIDPVATQDVTFNYTIVDVTTTSGVDYSSPQTGQCTIAAGGRGAQFSVLVNTDTDVEADETLTATISNASGNTTIVAATKTGTIVNDDQAASTMIITSTQFPGGYVGKTVAAALAATGGSGVATNYQWVLAGGAMPVGLTLNTDGTVIGTIGAPAGSYRPIIRVTDTTTQETVIKQFFVLITDQPMGSGATP